MKSKYKLITTGCMAAMFLLAGCGDDDNWSPGPEAEVENQVYFDDEDQSVEVVPSTEYDFTLSLSREDATEAASVPLTVSGSDLFETPATAEFAAGESSTVINVEFKGTGDAGSYSCTVSIPEGIYSSPYTDKTTSLTMGVTVANWELVAENVRFSSYNGWLPDFTADLYKAEGEEKYRFVNLFEGYDLTFTLDETYNYYIRPEGGLYGIDAWETGEAWYFGTTEAEYDTYKLYPKNYDGYYLLYCYIYTSDYYSSTYLDIENKEGCLMMDYYIYDRNTDDYTGTGGYDYIYIDW